MMVNLLPLPNQIIAFLDTSPDSPANELRILKIKYASCQMKIRLLVGQGP